MSSQPNQSLIDGLACLTALTAEREALTGRELARRLDLHHAKVNRLLMTLAELDFVRQDEKRRYVPSSGIHLLCALAGHGSGLLRRARPEIEKLHETWPDANIAIGVLWDKHVAYLYHANAHARASRAMNLPSLVPFKASSIGQVLAQSDKPYIALTHTHNKQKHRSVAVPIFEHGSPVAAISATTMPMSMRPKTIANRLEEAAQAISSTTEENPHGHDPG